MYKYIYIIKISGLNIRTRAANLQCVNLRLLASAKGKKRKRRKIMFYWVLNEYALIFYNCAHLPIEVRSWRDKYVDWVLQRANFLIRMFEISNEFDDQTRFIRKHFEMFKYVTRSVRGEFRCKTPCVKKKRKCENLLRENHRTCFYT